MAAVIRFERMKCRGQIPVPYHLAIPQCQADIKLSKKDKRKKNSPPNAVALNSTKEHSRQGISPTTVSLRDFQPSSLLFRNTVNFNSARIVSCLLKTAIKYPNANGNLFFTSFRCLTARTTLPLHLHLSVIPPNKHLVLYSNFTTLSLVCQAICNSFWNFYDFFSVVNQIFAIYKPFRKPNRKLNCNF